MKPIRLRCVGCHKLTTDVYREPIVDYRGRKSTMPVPMCKKCQEGGDKRDRNGQETTGSEEE